MLTAKQWLKVRRIVETEKGYIEIMADFNRVIPTDELMQDYANYVLTWK